MRAGRSGIRPVRESVPVGEQCYAFLDGSPQRAAQTVLFSARYSGVAAMTSSGTPCGNALRPSLASSRAVNGQYDQLVILAGFGCPPRTGGRQRAGAGCGSSRRRSGGRSKTIRPKRACWSSRRNWRQAAVGWWRAGRRTEAVCRLHRRARPKPRRNAASPARSTPHGRRPIALST